MVGVKGKRDVIAKQNTYLKKTWQSIKQTSWKQNQQPLLQNQQTPMQNKSSPMQNEPSCIELSLYCVQRGIRRNHTHREIVSQRKRIHQLGCGFSEREVGEIVTRIEIVIKTVLSNKKTYSINLRTFLLVSLFTSGTSYRFWKGRVKKGENYNFSNLFLATQVFSKLRFP